MQLGLVGGDPFTVSILATNLDGSPNVNAPLATLTGDASILNNTNVAVGSNTLTLTSLDFSAFHLAVSVGQVLAIELPTTSNFEIWFGLCGGHAGGLGYQGKSVAGGAFDWAPIGNAGFPRSLDFQTFLTPMCQ